MQQRFATQTGITFAHLKEELDITALPQGSEGTDTPKESDKPSKKSKEPHTRPASQPASKPVLGSKTLKTPKKPTPPLVKKEKKS